MSHWHSRRLEELFAQLETTADGLSEGQALKRLERWGSNELRSAKPPGLLQRILVQMKDPMILVLLGAAGLSLAASGGQDWLDAVIILVIVVVNCMISITQEDHAQKALEALKKMTSPTACCMRDGRKVRLAARLLVPGDVILLEAGDQVPADCRLLECAALRCDESAMTGESVPVEKELHMSLPEDAPLGDWNNMVISGTLVTAGRAKALVCATGMETQMGKIAALLMEGEQQVTPLQRKMGEISGKLSFLCLCVCAVMFGIGLLDGKNMLDMFLTAVSLAVAAIPEGLPAIVTIVLAMGVGRMAEQGAIVKKLPAVETLGCASVICSDKTGTLTQNRMTVQKLWTLSPMQRREAHICGALCSDAILEWKAGAPVAQGDPTEAALVVAAAQDGLDQAKLREEFPRKREVPFDSQRKMMSTIHAVPGGGIVYVKGAPDVLLERCEYGPKGELTTAERQRILRVNEEMASQAMRVLAVARGSVKQIPRKPESWNVERDLTFLGLFGLTDPPRKEAKEAVKRCHQAGIRPVMITGDHKATAVAIARELDIFREGDLSVTGAELDFMPQEILEEDIARFSVFARVSPEHKMRIVQAWQKKGKITAMTGDGVNDAPALKAADIGCAMGLTGTDAAKGAAEMILTDDNFSTIVRAVEEGRGIYSNIRKAIHYLLSCNIGEILTIFAATLLDLSQMPLIPVQLLWLNLVTDSLPALALGVEPVEDGVMDEPPRQAQESLFDKEFSVKLGWQGIMVGLLTLTAYFVGFCVLGTPGQEGASANTMAFATLTMSQLFHAFNVRSEERSLFSQGIFSNPAMNRAFATGFVLQLAVLLIPPLQGVFSVIPMTGVQWITVLALAMTPIPICEAEKWFRRRRKQVPSKTEELRDLKKKVPEKV